jgi:drug/metabolite transporter (DMT)-like permease
MVHSFGAPVWVIFLTVLGAGLLTIILVIQGVSGPPKFEPLDEAEVGQRMRAILEHQFFVLFAPLSGIFIFQLLVIAGAAKEPVTVATVILGAGATLNVLLARAVKSAEQYLQGKQTKEIA